MQCPILKPMIAVYCLCTFPLFALAQRAEPTQDNVPQLEVVTARGLEENNLEVPFTVNLLSAETIQKRRFSSVRDSLFSVPGVDIHSGGDVGNTYMWIRGTGSLSHTSLDDNTVGLRVDGANRGIVGLSQNLYDINRIEIAKGPQGTLFGSQAESGAVNIHTNNPEPFFDAHLEAGFGSNTLRTTQGMINVPLSDSVFARIATTSSWEDDYIHERQANKPLNKQKNQGIRTKILWQATPQTDVLVSAFYDRRTNQLPLVLFPPFDQHHPKFTAGIIPNEAERETRGLGLDIHHRFEGFQLQSSTNWTQHKGDSFRASRPLELLPYLYQQLNVPGIFQPSLTQFYENPDNNIQYQADDIRSFEQELRFSSRPENAVQWVVGAYFQHRDRDFTYNSKRGLFPFGPIVLNNDVYNADLKRQYRTTTQALFGELTYPLTDRLKGILGLRLNHEKIRYRASWEPNRLAPIGHIGTQYDTQNISDTTLTGRIGVDYAISPQWHTYALYSRGHKPAGFGDYSNNIAYGHPDASYRSGHIDAFELGIKGASQDGSWGIEAALFENKVNNDRISVSIYPTFITQLFNVNTRSRGLELNGFTQVSPALRLHAGASWIDAKVTKVPDTQQDITAKGNRVPQIPRFSATLGLEYRQELNLGSLATGDFFARADIRYVGKRAAEPNNELMLGSHTLVDASLGYETKRAAVTLWAKNLTNRQWMTYAMKPAGFNHAIGIPAQGRTIGLNVKYNFY